MAASINGPVTAQSLLPIEVWTKTLELLPATSTRMAVKVCRLFRDIFGLIHSEVVQDENGQYTRMKFTIKRVPLSPKITRNNVTHLFLTKVCFDLALAYVNSPGYRGLRQDTIQCISISYAKSGWFEDAFHFALTTKENKNYNIVLTKIIALQANAGLLDEAIASCEHFSDEEEKEKTLLHIAVCQMKSDLFEDAIGTASPLKGENRNTFFTVRSRLQAKAGFFPEAEVTSESIEDPILQEQALVNFAIIKTKNKEFKEAGVYVSRIKNDDAKHDKNILYIVKEQAKAGFYEDAEESAKKILSLGQQAKAKLSIAIFQAKSRPLEEAKSTFQEMAEKALSLKQTATLEEIGKAQAESGLLEEARETFQKLAKRALKLKQVGTLRKIGKAQAESGLLEEARETFQKTRNLLVKKAASYGRGKGRIYNNELLDLANSQMEEKLFDEAKITLEHVTYKVRRQLVIHNLAWPCCVNGPSQKNSCG